MFTYQIRTPKKRVPKKINGFIIGISWPIFGSRLTPRSKILLKWYFWLSRFKKYPVSWPWLPGPDRMPIPIPAV